MHWSVRKRGLDHAMVWAALAALMGCGSGETVLPDGQADGAQTPALGVDAGTEGDVSRADSVPSTASDSGPSIPPRDAGPAQAKSHLPCDVEAIVFEHCSACHSDPPQGAYMPLLTQAHFQAPSTTQPERAYFELAKDRINSDSDPMPPVDALSEADLATLNAWLEAGAPASDEACGGSLPNQDAGTSSDTEFTDADVECHKFLAHAPGDKNSPYQVGVARDSYINMSFTAPWEETVYGVTIRPIIDNAPVLHHWLLYRDLLGGLDGAVSGSSGQHTTGELIHGWAPGGSALDFTDRGEVGMEMPPGSYLMEFHYNSGDAFAADMSGAEVCFKRKPPKHVATMSWLGLDYGAESYISGAIGGAGASGSCLLPSDNWVGTCDPISDEPIHILAVWPHMHEAGVHMQAVINGPNGRRILHDSAFDFDYQKAYEVDEVLMPGETITTTCTYTKPSCSGQATTAEMCYLYTYAWPRGALRDLGPWGTFAHGDNVCLGQ